MASDFSRRTTRIQRQTRMALASISLPVTRRTSWGPLLNLLKQLVLLAANVPPQQITEAFKQRRRWRGPHFIDHMRNSPVIGYEFPDYRRFA